jgi:hypothetical protein
VVELLLKKETVDGSEVYAAAGRPEPAGGNRVTMAPDRGGPGPLASEPVAVAHEEAANPGS